MNAPSASTAAAFAQWIKDVSKDLEVTPAVSTGEAEYQALSTAARLVQWLKQLHTELGLPCTLVTIQCDSKGALSWTGDWKLEPRAKHIDIMHHFIMDLVLERRLAVKHAHTSLQLVYPFTKLLEVQLFWAFTKLLGLVTVQPQLFIGLNSAFCI
eukprot:gene19010-biopygen27874